MKKLAAILVLFCACQNADPVKAQKYAERYVKEHHLGDSVECANADTDGDGYITCTVFNEGQEPITIQCGAENWCMSNCADGCKYVPAWKGTVK